MSNFSRRADNVVFIALAIGPWGLLMAIAVIVALVRGCFEPPPDPTKDSVIKFADVVEHVIVTDSTDNGFRVVYRTKDMVTDEHFQELLTRPSIKEGFDRLKVDAPKHFDGDLLNADICDFALYAYHYPIDDDICIHNIFTYGKEKMGFYVQPNPNLENCATWMNYNTEQGNQYLNFHDINICLPNGGRKKYRYWKCRYLLQVSDTDERFSHFTEDERIY